MPGILHEFLSNILIVGKDCNLLNKFLVNCKTDISNFNKKPGQIRKICPGLNHLSCSLSHKLNHFKIVVQLKLPEATAQLFFIPNSTLRFLFLPSSVSFGAIGFEGP